MKFCSQCFQDEDDMWKSCVPWFGELWLVNGKGFGHLVVYSLSFKSAGEDHQQSRGG